MLITARTLILKRSAKSAHIIKKLPFTRNLADWRGPTSKGGERKGGGREGKGGKGKGREGLEGEGRVGKGWREIEKREMQEKRSGK